MNPILQALLMASRGHQGLPMTVQAGGPPPGPGPIAGPGPAAGPPPSHSGGDAQLAQRYEQMLVQASGQATDPQLKQVFSTCLAALHKYLAMNQKEQHQAMQGKLSPRLMAQQTGQ